jgi:transcriptional regulator GlxA family with amidase domain
MLSTEEESLLVCKDRRILRAVQYVPRDLSKRPSVAQLAKLAGLDRAYFCKIFRRTTGSSFRAWNRQVRIERAKHLLTASDTPIGLIAVAVGYSDVTTLERNFRKCANLSPREFRRSHR